MEHHDVVIIGAGTAGLQLSKLLEQSKINYITLEKRSSIGTYGPRIISIETLKKLNMSKSKLIKPIKKINFFSPNETLITKEDKQVRGFIINLKTVEKHIYSQILNKEKIKFNHNVVDFDLTKKTVKLMNGTEISFNKLIFATGLLGVKFRNKLNINHPKNAFCYAIEIKAKDEITTIIDNEIANGFYGWVIPLDENTIEIGYGAEELNIRDRNEIESKLKSLAHLKKYKSKKAIKTNGGFIPIGTINKRSNHDWIIIGDAAGGEPMLGGSIHKCLDEAQICHDVLIKNIKNKTNSMKEYDIEWDKLFLKEMKSQYKIREILDNATNKQLNETFKKLQGKEIDGEGLINDLFRNIIINLTE